MTVREALILLVLFLGGGLCYWMWVTHKTLIKLAQVIHEQLDGESEDSLPRQIHSLTQSTVELERERTIDSFELDAITELERVPLFHMDPAGSVNWCNKAYLEFWGFVNYEQACSDRWLTKLSTVGQELSLQRLQMAVDSEPKRFSYSTTLKDGSLVEFKNHPIFDGEKPAGWVGTVLRVGE